MQAVNLKTKILLIEDNTNLSENISELLKINGYEILRIFDSADSVMEYISGTPPDLILIDIKLKGSKTGIELAHDLRNEFKVPIVFITSASGKDVISKVRHLHPDGFIVKPFTKESLITTIELAIANYKSDELIDNRTSLIKTQNTPDELFIRENGWLKKIKIDDIQWIKAEGTYTQLYAEGKQYTLRNTAKEILSKLNEDQFHRVHKSYIINLKKIDAFNSSTVKILDSEIPIGRNYYKELINMVNKITN
ncbi:LytR/AlgR family response regulator transcription factor [Algoriphagus sp. PAP.12]|uniref:LytR/AlgR family response regulator transcription factor n=1 Tax=Algoriphagus sp. PAP.12 TaxID=2996678 RepID=UPI00227CD4C2|nr:response regulator transcription factor [Algoriphagus sp. PAP.12]